MGERTGIGLIERLVLQTMADIGVHHDHVYSTLCALAADWLLPVPLVDGHGNLGSADIPPAVSRYMEARLSPAGLLAVRSECGDLPKLPFGLVLGDMYAGGTSPPFDPARLLDALTMAIDHPDVADSDLAAAVGPPVFPTVCSVDVDASALHAGDQTRVGMSARISVEDIADGPRLIVTNLPLGAAPNEVFRSIAGRSRVDDVHDRHPDLAAATRLPIVDLNDESSRHETRIVCTLEDGADVDQTISRLLDLWPVSVERPCRLDAPIGTLVRQAVDDDPTAQLDAIARLRATVAF